MQIEQQNKHWFKREKTHKQE